MKFHRQPNRPAGISTHVSMNPGTAEIGSSEVGDRLIHSDDGRVRVTICPSGTFSLRAWDRKRNGSPGCLVGTERTIQLDLQAPPGRQSQTDKFC